MKYLVLILLLVSSVASAGDDKWTKLGSTSETGSLAPALSAEYHPTTAGIGTLQTKTIATNECLSGTVTCYGADLSGVIQMCNSNLDIKVTDIEECRDMTASAIDCATSHSVQIDPMPHWLRISAMANAAVTANEKFVVTCNGAKR